MKPRLLAPHVRMLITEHTFYHWGLVKIPIEPGEQNIPAEAAPDLEARGHGTIVERPTPDARRVMAPRQRKRRRR